MKSKLLLVFCLLAGLGVQAQQYFTPVRGVLTAPENAQERTWLPGQYSAWELQLSQVSAVIKAAPMEFTPAAYYNNATVISVPMPDGGTEDFTVYNVQTCEPAVYEKHPEIRTFAGRSLRNPNVTMRGSITVRGFRLMILHNDGNVGFVEPYYNGQTQYYIAYHQDAVPTETLPQGLSRGIAPNAVINTDPGTPALATQPAADRSSAELVKMKVYRFAVSCTGEFGQDHGGTQEGAFAGVVEYTNWVNSIFERDIALRLQLVEKSVDVAFFNPTTDPFPSTNPLALLSQNALVINGFIGINNYDIAHVYSRYDPATAGGILGVAGTIGNGCVQSSKAEGVSTGFASIDYGANFVNTIGQEVGHQLGGGHTWNRCGGGNGRNGASAFEPGSGSTIMSYAGACGSDNVANDSDLYFHAGSIEEIAFYYTALLGANCGTFLETTNHKPEVTLEYTNDFFIPILTPFELDGSATDADGDSLLYCWEQMNTALETPLEAPVGDVPIFRTRPPGDKTNRYFPQLSTVLNNTFDLAEQLPTYTRDLDFRLSARDNRVDGGVGWKDVAFKATELAGPFLVVSPNATSDIWKVGEFATVKWDVANTFNAPVNCKKVNIRLSTDGGLTWPITLATDVSNDGEHLVSVPDNVTTKARIRVDAADNIFFDVSNANFKIQAPSQPSFTAAMSENSASICLPNNFTADVLTASVLGFNNPATISIIPGNLPAEAVVSLSTNTVQPGQSAVLNVNMEAVTVAGTYSFNVKVSASGAPDVTFPVTLTTFTNDFSTMGLSTPVDGSTNMVQSQILRWTKADDADSYNLQLAKNPSFDPASIVATKTNTQVDTFKIPFLLDKNQAYFWRIRPNNVCSPHAWTEPFFFSTLSETCNTFGAPDLPKNVPPSIVSTIESKIELLANTVITDINIKQLKGFHGEFSDLDVRLTSPSGTEVTLFKSRCAGYNGVFDLSLDDSAPNSFTCPPNNTGGTYVRPQTPLAQFIGQNAQGLWVLKAKDQVAGEGGSLDALQLDICQSLEVNPPVVINNNGLALESGTNKGIGPDLLLVNDPDNTHDQLTFTLLTVPYFGELTKNFVKMEQGESFTQTDIDNGNIRYYNYGTGESSDYFRFVVTDGSGGYLGTPVFLIQIAVDAKEVNAAYGFKLAPNPANTAVWINLEQPVGDNLQVALFNISGQLVHQEVLPAGTLRQQIPVGNLPRGLYVAQISGQYGVRVEKLILR